MDFRVAKCPNCSGELQIPSHEDVVKCKYCGYDVIVDKLIKDTSQDSFEDIIQLALSAFEKKEYKEANKYLTQALKIKPKADDLLYMKGVCEQANQNDIEAVDCWKKALLINPNNENAKQELYSLRKRTLSFIDEIESQGLEKGRIYKLMDYIDKKSYIFEESFIEDKFKYYRSILQEKEQTQPITKEEYISYGALKEDQKAPDVVGAVKKKEDGSPKTRSANKWWLIVLPFLGFVIWFAFDYANRNTILITFGVGLGIVLIILVSGKVMQCPVCRKWWARKFTGKEEVGRQGGYKTITRQDIRRNAKGEEIGRTERQEQVHVIQVTHQNYYQCKYCHHSWTNLSTSEYEG